MTNAELFEKTFGRFATEIWALPENEFLEWLKADTEIKGAKMQANLICEHKRIKSNLYNEWMTIRNQIDIILDVLKESEENEKEN